MMKLSRPAAVSAAVVLLAGGAAVAVGAPTATDPVTLCAHTRTGAVLLPEPGGVCDKHATAFQVASDDDVQALAGRLDASDERAAAQSAEITALRAEIEDLRRDLEDFRPAGLEITTEPHAEGWAIVPTGWKLEPGAAVFVNFTYAGRREERVIGSAADDGTFSRTPFPVRCTFTDVSVSSVAADGDPVESNVITSGPGC